MTVTAKALIDSKFAANAATTEYTAPTSTRTIVDKFTATNTDTGAQTITIYLVPNGGTASASNTVIQAKSLSSGSTYDFTELKNQIFNTGDFIAVSASIASKVVIRASGREVT